MTIQRIVWPPTQEPQLRRVLEKFNDDVVRFSIIPEYADNATAVAAGLQVGDLYHTAAGVVMVVV